MKEIEIVLITSNTKFTQSLSNIDVKVCSIH